MKKCPRCRAGAVLPENYFALARCAPPAGRGARARLSFRGKLRARRVFAKRFMSGAELFEGDF